MTLFFSSFKEASVCQEHRCPLSISLPGDINDRHLVLKSPDAVLTFMHHYYCDKSVPPQFLYAMQYLFQLFLLGI